MKARSSSDQGIGIVEVVIGMLLLAIIAVAILPSLWQGLRFTSEQSATATATRQLNSIVEQIRDNPTCANIAALTTSDDITDGADRTLRTSGTHTGCPAPTKTVTIALVAQDASGSTLARVSAIVYVP